MVFLFQDQNQGTRKRNSPREKAREASRPFSFIRTLTVGFGITPNLLTLLPEGIPRGKALAGLGFRPYRRWGISPRPENIGRPEWANLPETMAEGRDASKPFAMGKRHIPMPPARFAAMPAPDLIRVNPGSLLKKTRQNKKLKAAFRSEWRP
jgi:hypothetical protein